MFVIPLYFSVNLNVVTAISHFSFIFLITVVLLSFRAFSNSILYIKDTSAMNSFPFGIVPPHLDLNIYCFPISTTQLYTLYVLSCTTLLNEIFSSENAHCILWRFTLAWVQFQISHTLLQSYIRWIIVCFSILQKSHRLDSTLRQ